MNNIWSENKYLNLIINILLFLVGINFWHYGQLILPVICFLLFIDNRLRFRVNDPITFIILCLFGIGFYAFTYKLGFYSVMGFTLPMAYYIGSNMKEVSSDNIRRIIYLLAAAMGLHVVLNAIIEMILHGTHGFFFSSSHYDFWTREKISNTGTAINIDLLIGCLYYVLFKESDRKIRSLLIIIFVLGMFYLTVIGRRTPLMMIAIIFAVLFLYESRVRNSISQKVRKTFIMSACAIALFAAAVIIVYHFDLFGLRDLLDNVRIIHKFKQGFITDSRFGVWLFAVRNMLSYPFGGQKISEAFGLQVHELWLDIYDYAGVIPYVLMLAYTFIYVKNSLKVYGSEKIDENMKVLFIGVILVIAVQMFLEPVMTGASLFLIIAVIVGALLERLVADE